MNSIASIDLSKRNLSLINMTLRNQFGSHEHHPDHTHITK